MECLRDSFLIQHVKDPTHQNKVVVGNILDLILTNEEGMINEVLHEASFGNSDHQILTFKFNHTPSRTTRIRVIVSTIKGTMQT